MAGVSDEAFARYASQAALATGEQLDEARSMVADAAQRGQTLGLAEALVFQGVITATQKESVEKKLLAQQHGGLQQLGNYKLIKKLGEGGMGAVYLAEDTTMLRKVALKVLPKKYASDPEFLTRFRREAKAAGKLNHVNIISAFTVGEELGNHFYVMEYCEGEPLDKILKRESVLTWDYAIEITIQIARGLQHAHGHGLIHRDIKPANIFMASNASSTLGKGTDHGIAKILDMGLSKDIGGGEQSFNTQTGMALGTPHYISPEQAKGEKSIDGRTDIYSLGATLYHLLTGQTPFTGSTAAMIIMKHLTDQIPNPQDLRENIPDAVVMVIQKMMAKDSADRYTDCAELLEDLELVIDGKTPSSAEFDPGKSSVAMRQVKRIAAQEAADRMRRRTGPQPAGTRQHEAVAEARGDDRRQTDRRSEARGPDPKNKMYIAAGVAAMGLLVFLLGLMGGGKKPSSENSEVRNTNSATIPKAEIQNQKFVTPAHAVVAPPAELPKEIALDLGAGVKMEMVLVPAGEFMMGDENTNGKPIHNVKITRPFYLGKYEVTQPQYEKVMGNNPSQFKWPDLPVEQVSWDDAKAFCKRSAAFQPASQLAGRMPALRLPTEAEWEYACRAGTTTEFNTGQGEDALEKAGWYNRNARGKTNPVGKKIPNAWDLYDMHGNVWEWCEDWLDENYYVASPPADPKGPDKGGARVMRGGSWNGDSNFCRPRRNGFPPGNRRNNLGFRVLLEVPPGPAPVAVNQKPETSKPETGVTDAWIKSVQALPAEKQVEAVVAKLKALNPGFDGKVEHEIQDGAVTRLKFGTENVMDISPLRTLSGLRDLHIGQSGVRSSLRDLSALRGLRLVNLSIYDCREISDLEPLRGMPLSQLVTNSCPISDLSPLTGMPLKSLYLAKTRVSDLAPLRDLASQSLHLDITDTAVTDLSPLKGKPLHSLWCLRTKITDFSPLKDTMKSIKIDFDPMRHGSMLRSIKTLEKINDMPVAEFWNKASTLERRSVLLTEDFEKLQLNNLPAGWTVQWASELSIASVLDGSKTLRITRPKADNGIPRLSIPLDVEAIKGRTIRASVMAYCPQGYTAVKDGNATWAMPRLLFKVDNDERAVSYLYPDQRDLKQLVTPPWTVPAGTRQAWLFIDVPFVAAKVYFDDLVIEIDPNPKNTPPKIGAAQPDDAVDDPARWKDAVNLLSLIDPPKDQVAGAWRKEGGALLCNDGRGARIEVPYTPPEEYDFKMTFTRLQGFQPVNQLLFARGVAFGYAMGFKRGDGKGGYSGPQLAAFEVVGEKMTGWEGNPTAAAVNIGTGTSHTSIIQVRRDGLRAFLDGKLVSELKTDYKDLSPNPDWKLNVPARLGVGSWVSPIRVDVLELLEIYDFGEFSRPGDLAAKEAKKKQDGVWAKKKAEVPFDPREEKQAEVSARPDKESERVVWNTDFEKDEPRIEDGTREAGTPQGAKGFVLKSKITSANDDLSSVMSVRFDRTKEPQPVMSNDLRLRFQCRTENAYYIYIHCWLGNDLFEKSVRTSTEWQQVNVKLNEFTNITQHDGSAPPAGAVMKRLLIYGGGAKRGTTTTVFIDNIALLDSAANIAAAAAAANLPKELVLELGNGVKMEMVLVPAGEFMMGSNNGDANEKPVHKVRISQPFYIGKYEVSVAQFRAFAESAKYQTECEKPGVKCLTMKDGRFQETTGFSWKAPGFKQEDNHPVVLVSWADSQAFAAWAGKATGRDVRLASEAQWEYAARGPENRTYPWGNTWEGALANHADVVLKDAGATPQFNCTTDNDGFAFTSPAGSLKNASWCGAFDMSGNVWEWVADEYQAEFYSKSPQADPQSQAGGNHVLRGGCWNNLSPHLRCARRYNYSYLNSAYGFRVVIGVSVKR